MKYIAIAYKCAIFDPDNRVSLKGVCNKNKVEMPYSLMTFSYRDNKLKKNIETFYLDVRAYTHYNQQVMSFIRQAMYSYSAEMIYKSILEQARDINTEYAEERGNELIIIDYNSLIDLIKLRELLVQDMRFKNTTVIIVDTTLDECEKIFEIPNEDNNIIIYKVVNDRLYYPLTNDFKVKFELVDKNINISILNTWSKVYSGELRNIWENKKIKILTDFVNCNNNFIPVKLKSEYKYKVSHTNKLNDYINHNRNYFQKLFCEECILCRNPIKLQ